MKKKIKQQIKRIICRLPFILRLMAYKTRNWPRIFMYHRFTADESEVGLAVTTANFDWQLRQLQGRWNVISLAEYVRFRRQNLKVPPYTVILTIDDGYRDFYDVAYPLLCKYHFPATFFVTTAFVNGEIWLWHDCLYYILEHAAASNVKIPLGKRTIALRTSTETEKAATWQLLSDYCIDVTDEEKWQLIKLVEEKLQVAVPTALPDKFAAVSWEQLKEMVNNGIEIGSHSVTHPVLSQVAPVNLSKEIVQSKKIIAGETGKEVITCCYPNGRDVDINSLVLSNVEKAGYLGAVQGFGLDFSNLYRLPRLGISNDRFDFLWKLNGFEQIFLK